MKKGTSILVDSFLCIHQILIGNIVLMKRESRSVRLFSFGEHSDEWLMKIYRFVCQCVDVLFHQIISFSFTYKSIENMKIEEAKNIRIADYLHSLGYNPVKQQGSNLWYKSPFREEHDASFKVNMERNLWYDFGMGKGGNIIALAKELYFCDSLPYLLNRIAEQTPHIHPVSFSFQQQRAEPSFQQLEVHDLTHPALLRYLQGRGINIGLAKEECKELHFTHNGKPYFAIGFSNVAGGYEVRNSFFKGCIAPKDITHIRQQGEPREKCMVFEEFMDYLSFLTLRMKHCSTMPDLDKQDYVILNSTANVSKAIEVLYPYERIHCMLDNDEAGYKATRAISLEYSYHVHDYSHNYRGYSDLNDYLCGKKQEQATDLSQQTMPARPSEQVKRIEPAERQKQMPAVRKSKGFRM